MLALLLNTFSASVLFVIAFFMMLTKTVYFNHTNPTLMITSGCLIVLAILIHKNTEAPYFSKRRTDGKPRYFISTLVIIMVINGAFDLGFSSEPVRLLVMGVGYLGLKHLMKARIYYEQLGLNPR